MTIRRFARNSLAGHYAHALYLTLLTAAAVLLRGMAPAACVVCSGDPRGLFLQRDPLWMLLRLGWGSAVLCLLLPLVRHSGRWFSARLGLACSPRGAWHAAGGLLLAEVLRLAAAAPAVLCGAGMLYALRQAAAVPDGGLWLFAAVQAGAGMLWTGALYAGFCMDLTALPLWQLVHPQVPAWTAIRRTRDMLRGHRMAYFRRLLRAAGAMLLPVLLPYAAAELVLFLQLRMREYDAQKGWEPCPT